MQDPLSAMHIFVRVAELRSFTQAALVLGLSKTHVSNRVAQLEQWAGARLLQRTTRSVTLTHDGQQFYRRCQLMLDEMQDLESLFTTKEAELSGVLRIDMPTGLARKHVLPRLGAFLDAHPKLNIELSCTDRRVDVVAEGFDAVVRGGAVQDEGLVARHLADLKHQNLASPDYLARHGTPLHPDELGGHYLINYAQVLGAGEGSFDYVAGRQLGAVAMPSRITVNSAEAYQQACLAGLGIIQVPVLPGQAMAPLVAILADYVPPPMPLWLLYPHRRHLSKRLLAFSNWLADSLHQPAGSSPTAR